jgi:hypothetical protein
MVQMSAGDVRLMALATLNERLDRAAARRAAQVALSASAFQQQLQLIEVALRRRLARSGRLRSRTSASGPV